MKTKSQLYRSIKALNKVLKIVSQAHLGRVVGRNRATINRWKHSGVPAACAEIVSAEVNGLVSKFDLAPELEDKPNEE